MSLMQNPRMMAFFCWFEGIETIEEGWQCEAESAKAAAEQYYAHVGVSGDAIVCVGGSASHERWMVRRSGFADALPR